MIPNTRNHSRVAFSSKFLISRTRSRLTSQQNVQPILIFLWHHHHHHHHHHRHRHRHHHRHHHHHHHTTIVVLIIISSSSIKEEVVVVVVVLEIVVIITTTTLALSELFWKVVPSERWVETHHRHSNQRLLPAQRSRLQQERPDAHWSSHIIWQYLFTTGNSTSKIAMTAMS